MARSHFRALRIDGRRWAITDALAGIHCAGLRGRDFATLRSRGGAMVWSPMSNLLLYGATADLPRAVRERVRIGLGSDWSPSGSKNLLSEMKVAWVVAQELDAGIDARDLVAMATIEAARILKWDGSLGSIEPGKRADLVVVHGRRGDPYGLLLEARETSITLSIINGRARYGQPRMMQQLAGDGEALQVGGSDRILDLSDEHADPVIGELSLSEARDRLEDGMARLPELARRMDDGSISGALLGATSATEPGNWFLELDHEPRPGFSARPHLPFAGMPTGIYPEVVLGAPLADILQPMELDPLTVVDDGGYWSRLADSPNLPGYLLAELPPLYGQRPRQRGARAEASLPSADGAQEPDRLGDFLAATASTLTTEDRLLLVQQAMVLLGETYVHLELKRSMHAVEPIQQLRLLRYRLTRGDDELSDLAFHRELARIFASVRDLHTNYLLPSPLRERTAFLPFRVERYVEDGQARYVVSHVFADVHHPTFTVGAEVEHWNGVPIERAIEINARVQGGSNRAAAFARGLESLTIRPLVRTLPPDEDWVVVDYRGLDGIVREERWDWLVWAPPAAIGVDPDDADAPSRSTALGYDLQADAVNHAKKVLYARRAFDVEPKTAAALREPVAVGSQEVATRMPSVFRARQVETSSGAFAYVRIFTFNVPDADVFVAEFVRLAEQLPPDGLIIDVRGNGGGLILAAEQLLQVFTPRAIAPSRAQFITTPLMLELCERHAPSPLDRNFDLSGWVDSMAQAVTTGAVYSQALPITDRQAANEVGQTYQGPVVLITDALCYSATDMFAAGFRDHDIGTILGVDDNTGAGGANVWTHELLRLLMDTEHPRPSRSRSNPFRELPNGAGMRVSVRRTIRVGDRDGTPLEDLGVTPHVRHHMTRDDVLGSNQDLIDHAGEFLAAASVHRLDVAIDELHDDTLTLTVTASNVDRVDIRIDGRGVDSFDVTAATTRRIAVPVASPTRVDLHGYLDGRPVVRARRPLVTDT